MVHRWDTVLSATQAAACSRKYTDNDMSATHLAPDAFYVQFVQQAGREHATVDA
jgi:hypothetical protein